MARDEDLDVISVSEICDGENGNKFNKECMEIWLILELKQYQHVVGISLSDRFKILLQIHCCII